MSTVRRPSQDRIANVVYGSTFTRIVDVGEVTSGRLNSACALIGTSSSASTSGHTTGPPAENAYAVDPVGVAHTTPSQPYRDSRRPSTSTSTSSIFSRAPFSTDTSLSAQDRAISSPSHSAVTSTVSRSSTVYAPTTTSRTARSRLSSSASARKPTRPRLMPSSGAPAGRATSAARSTVPSPPSANTISTPSAASGPVTG